MRIFKKISAQVFAVILMLMTFTTPVLADMSGIDVSGWQPAIQTDEVDADFVIVKATQGTSYKNPYRNLQLGGAIRSGKKIGVYHFATGTNAVAEADFFVETVSDYVGEAVLVLDYESTAVKQGTGYVKSFCDRVYSKTGVKPIVYTSASVVHSQNFSAVEAAGYGLWVAGYPSTAATGYNPTLNMPYDLGAYDEAVMWQYTSNGHISGYSGRLDLNVYYGDESDWDELASTGDVTTGSTTESGEVKETTSTNTPSGTTLSLAYYVMANSVNGESRKSYLGTRYTEVQNFINSVFSDSTSTLVTNTLADVYGSGQTRKVVLDSRYSEVMKVINRRYAIKNTQIKVDGILGKETIKAWQRQLGVTADGIIGRKTIRAIQRWAGTTVDGIMGPQTRKAVQRKLGVTADGIWGKKTISALQRYLNN